jgi:diaminohydroxyphosphoribosylaminopyrimidine deaminase / 5-amino-6-(5-phosphoribosylamino)uracil reductase
MNQDELHLQRCFALAEQGRHTCRPNPVVGCVIVKGGAVIAEGWHKVAGEAHAEVHALQLAGERAQGSTVYVSLEPCVHQGRTGPCTEALIASGIERLVYAMQDPNPLVSGKGLAKLREAGIAVVGPLLRQQAEDLNPGFIKRMTKGLPYVRCKVGMSLDGRTAMPNGESQWITGPEARTDVQQLRARSCAVLTGVGTVLRDDPSLTVRLDDYKGLQPLRVIADTNGRTPLDARLLHLPGEVLLACSEPAARERGKPTTEADVTIEDFPLARGQVDLHALLRGLAVEWQCNEVLVEAGPTLTGALLQAGLVDELITYIAPSLLGDLARPLATLRGLDKLDQKLTLEFTQGEMIGQDFKLVSRVRN